MKAREFLKQLNHDDIVEAIRQAELKTSGELRVFISRKNVDEPVAAAKQEFEKLGMQNTRERNGVMIFLAPLTHQFAIIGDEAVNSRCGQDFWTALAAEMTEFFRKSEFSRGIIHGITKAGDLLAQHFPRSPDDRNELPNQVVRD
jgi:uncharacterized membrane protein